METVNCMNSLHYNKVSILMSFNEKFHNETQFIQLTSMFVFNAKYYEILFIINLMVELHKQNQNNLGTLLTNGKRVIKQFNGP